MITPTMPFRFWRNAFSEGQLQEQIERIVRSRVFEHSQTLQRLLQYLSEKSIKSPGEQIKEYTIGVEALNRRQDFDPKEDTIVRVQIYRLRQKLQEYYESEGSQDPIRVTIPKGYYLPAFTSSKEAKKLGDLLEGDEVQPAATKEESSLVAEQAVALPEVEIEENIQAVPVKVSRKIFIYYGAAVAAALLLFWLGWAVGSRWSSSASHPPDSIAKADPARTFWMSFAGSDSSPIVVFADAVYLLDESNDLFPYPSGAIDSRGATVDPELARKYTSNPSLVSKAGRVYYESGYTGIGDLKGVAVMVNFLTRIGLNPTVKSSRDLTTEDFKEHNVILLGSPYQNMATEQMAPGGGLIYDTGSSLPPSAWNGKILDLHPRPQEPSIYKTERDPVTRILKADYSLVAIQPGIIPGRYVAILGGLDTTGTEGAALFATSQSGVDALLKSSTVTAESPKKNQPPLFQAIVRVNLSKGSQVLGSSLVTVHDPPLKSPTFREAASN